MSCVRLQCTGPALAVGAGGGDVLDVDSLAAENCVLSLRKAWLLSQQWHLSYALMVVAMTQDGVMAADRGARGRQGT
jgi:hypothetical protein